MMMSRRKSMVYSEKSEILDPTTEDIQEFAKRIGIDVDKEPELLYLAREGLQEKLPHPWKPCLDTHRNAWYYFNEEKLKSQWEHPLNAVYRRRVVETRKQIAGSKNLPQGSETITNMPGPLKSLPPLKKLGGASRVKPNSFDALKATSTLQTTTQRTIGDGGENVVKTLSSNPKENSKVTGDPTAKPFSEIIKETRNDPERQSNTVSSDVTAERALKKLGLTLTGQGSHFVKRDAAEVRPGTTSGMRKSSVGNEELGAINPFSTQKDEDSDWDLSNKGKMTELEEKIWKSIESSSHNGDISTKEVGGEKYKLDQSTELKFDFHNENLIQSSETKSGNQDPLSNSEDDSDTRPFVPEYSKPSARNKSEINDLKEILNKASSSKSCNAASISAQKAVMKKEMELELKIFKESLQAEKEKQENHLKQEFQQAVDVMKADNAQALKKAKQKLQEEHDLELEKIKTAYKIKKDEDFQKLKAELQGKETALKLSMNKEKEKELAKLREELNRRFNAEKESLELKLREDLKSLKEQLDAEKMIATANAKSQMSDEQTRRYKAVSDNLRIDHRNQIEQLKEFHNELIAKMRESFEKEIEDLKNDNENELAELAKSVQKKKEDLMNQLKTEQQTGVTVLNKELLGRKMEMLMRSDKTLSELEQILLPNQLEEAQGSRNETLSPSASQKLFHNDLNDTLSSHHGETKNLELWRHRYHDLQNKYVGLKKELQDVLAAVAAQTEEQERRKLESRDNKSREDSANASITNSESSYFRSRTPDIPKEQVTGACQSCEEEYLPNQNADRLENALKSLEVLKIQIMELKKEQQQKKQLRGKNGENKLSSRGLHEKSLRSKGSNLNGSSTARSVKSAKLRNQKQTAKPKDVIVSSELAKVKKPSTGVENMLDAKDWNGHFNDENAASKKENILGDSGAMKSPRLKFPVASASERLSKGIPNLNTGKSGHGDYSEVIQEAKTFLREQRAKIKQRSSSNPCSPSTNGKMSIEPRISSRHMDKINIARKTDFVSETESSGLGSMREEKAKVSKDIDIICQNLANLDEQMKIMWSYLGRDGINNEKWSRERDNFQQQHPTPSISMGGLQNNWERNHHDSIFEIFHPNFDGCLPNSKGLNYPSSIATSSLVLSTSLDNEYREFQSTKNRILQKFKSASTEALSDEKMKQKTEDLKAWLQKL